MLSAIDIVCRQITVTRTVLQDIAMPLLTSFIDGRYVPERADAERFETIDPATGEVLAEVQAATDADIDDAVASARQGQQAWAALTPVERARILNRAVELLRDANHELAELESRDTGKPLSETRAVDIVTGADVIEYYAGLAVAIEGRQIPLRPTSFVYTRQEPLGVVAGIGAWNYPIQIAMWKSAPALAAGNAIWPRSSWKRGCRPASSTWCRATGGSARRSASIPTSPRSPSPAAWPPARR